MAYMGPRSAMYYSYVHTPFKRGPSIFILRVFYHNLRALKSPHKSFELHAHANFLGSWHISVLKSKSYYEIWPFWVCFYNLEPPLDYFYSEGTKFFITIYARWNHHTKVSSSTLTLTFWVPDIFQAWNQNLIMKYDLFDFIFTIWNPQQICFCCWTV